MRPIHSVSELAAVVRESAALRLRGGGTKEPLWRDPEHAPLLDLSALRGIVEYDPAALVNTARAATPVLEIEEALAAHGQALPFDPLLARAGSTLGGTVAAGSAGSGRLRYGGIRDFLIGVQLVDCQGNLVRGGARVVKNAAGFDLPKLVIGSRGRLGALTELSFKVFPSPRARSTVSARFADRERALEALVACSQSAFELDAADLVFQDGSAGLWLRLGGLPQAVPARADRVARWLGEQPGAERPLVSSGAEEPGWWLAARELTFVPDGWSLLKVPTTPRGLPALERAIAHRGGSWPRRYLAAGALALVCVPDEVPLGGLESLLESIGARALVLRGHRSPALLGTARADPFALHVARALDPAGVLRGGDPAAAP